MKKICKGMAIFAIMAGLACMTSCASVGEIFGSMFGGTQTVAGFQTKDSSKEYAGLMLKSNGEAEAIRYSNSTKVKGKWESSGGTKSIKDGDSITITIENKTVKGTVRQISSNQVQGSGAVRPGDKTDDYTLTTYSVNLGEWGPYTYEDKKYESVK